MKFTHFSVTGELRPYTRKPYPDSQMPVATVKIKSGLTLGHLKDALRQRSGPPLTARWQSNEKDGHIIICATASTTSILGIKDVLNDLDLLLDQKVRASKREAERLEAAAAGHQPYRNKPKGLH